MAVRTWTPGPVYDRAKELWAKNLSGTEIARTLNAEFENRFTRDMILGIAWRDGWGDRPIPVKKVA
jgi:hypothetical protein